MYSRRVWPKKENASWMNLLKVSWLPAVLTCVKAVNRWRLCPADGRSLVGSTWRLTPARQNSSQTLTAQIAQASRPKLTSLPRRLSTAKLIANTLKKIPQPKQVTRLSSRCKFWFSLNSVFSSDASAMKNLHAENNFGRANIEPHEGLHWAGGQHLRKNFNKTKDPIVNWTEVLFRNWSAQVSREVWLKTAKAHKSPFVTDCRWSDLNLNTVRVSLESVHILSLAKII